MRILQVVHGFPPKQKAGTQIYTYYLSKELSRKHDIHVFYPTLDTTINENYTIRSFRRENLYLHELVIPNKFANKLKMFKNLFFIENYINKKIEQMFKELLEELKPGIIHFQHLIYLSTTLIDVAKKFNVPTVLTLHDYWFICPNEILFRFDCNATCEGPEPYECHKCWTKKQSIVLSDIIYGNCHVPKFLTRKPLELILRLLNPPEKFKKRYKYLKHLLLKVDKIIAPSKFLRELFIKHGIPKEKIIYSENGYNLDLFTGFKKKKKEDKIIFGFVGGIYKHKGIDILIEAFNNIDYRNVELRIYGRCNSIYLKNLKKKIKNPNIKFMGQFEDVKEPYSEIDILVVPSIWPETGGPLVVKEAFATKTPVIASNIGCIPEFVEDGKTGLLFEPNSPNDLYKKIIKIIENPKLLESFKANITPPKSIKEQAEEVEKIYERVCYEK